MSQQIGGRLNLQTKKVGDLEGANKSLTNERDVARVEAERLKTELETAAKYAAEKSARVQALEDAIQEKEATLITLRTNVTKLRNAGRNYKEKFEAKEKELADKVALMAKLDEELKKLKESPAAVGAAVALAPASAGADAAETGSVASTGDDKLAEAELLVSCDFLPFKFSSWEHQSKC